MNKFKKSKYPKSQFLIHKVSLHLSRSSREVEMISAVSGVECKIQSRLKIKIKYSFLRIITLAIPVVCQSFSQSLFNQL